jgi:riboflavin-specific deaminase-like protein
MNEFSVSTADTGIIGDDARSWSIVPECFRTNAALPEPWAGRFDSLRIAAPDGLCVVGQIGQSLDGRVATASGHSHYINGPEGLDHLHRLRALVDAVVIGVGTAVADDPQLTVRRVAGPHPARVVIDPQGRLPRTAKCLKGDGVRRIVLTATGLQAARPKGVEAVGIAAPDGAMRPADILSALAGLGLRRILIEGGANTVSRFMAAGCLDRLHIVVAPVVIGEGPAGITLPPIATMEEAWRPPVRTHTLGDEVLFDCDLSAQRAPGRAKKST